MSKNVSISKDELAKLILNAQIEKPRGILTGTSNWAYYIANSVIRDSKVIEPIQPTDNSSEPS